MTLYKLIKLLEKFAEEHGDMDVKLYDYGEIDIPWVWRKERDLTSIEILEPEDNNPKRLIID